MNKYKQVIEIFKIENELMEFNPSTGEKNPIELQNKDNQDLYKANLVAISALEKQIPKKPAETFTDGAFKRPYSICPVCESYVNRIYHRENCGKCSQKLDWSVEE